MHCIGLRMSKHWKTTHCLTFSRPWGPIEHISALCEQLSRLGRPKDLTTAATYILLFFCVFIIENIRLANRVKPQKTPAFSRQMHHTHSKFNKAAWNKWFVSDPSCAFVFVWLWQKQRKKTNVYFSLFDHCSKIVKCTYFCFFTCI